MFKEIIDRVEIILTVFLTFLTYCPCSLFLFFCLSLFLPLVALTEHFIGFVFFFFRHYHLLCFLTVFSCYPRVCPIHCQPIQIHFQITSYHSGGSERETTPNPSPAPWHCWRPFHSRRSIQKRVCIHNQIHCGHCYFEQNMLDLLRI